MKKVVLFSAVVMIAGLLGACSKSSSTDCSDYAAKICGKLNECGFLVISKSECTSALSDGFKNDRTSTADCKTAWEEFNSASCSTIWVNL